MIFIEHWLSWLIFFGFIAALIYTLKTIDREDEFVEENHQVFEIGNFQLKVPNWWTDNLTSSTAQTISFERTDTTYEWFAEFTWFLKANTPTGGLDDFLRQNMELDGMEFDLSEVTLTENASYPQAKSLKMVLFNFIASRALPLKTKPNVVMLMHFF